MLLRDNKRTASHALVVDTRDGTWRSVGGSGAHFSPTETSGYWSTVPVVLVSDYASATPVTGGAGKKIWNSYYDTDTGAVFKSGWSNMTLPEVEERIARRRSASIRGWRRQWPLGLGAQVARDREMGVYDPFRDKIFPWPGYRHRTVVRPGLWLMRKGGRNQEWKFYDPETRQYSDAPKLPQHFAMLPDGRILTSRAKQAAIVNPDSGVSVPFGAEYDAQFNLIPSSWLFKVWREQGCALMRLDPESLEFETIAEIDPSFDPLLVDDTFLLGRERERRVVRIDLTNGERKVIFPR